MNQSKMKTMVMARGLGLGLLLFLPLAADAQRLLTLDSCRAMALRNNKQLGVAKVKQEASTNMRKSARTQYLPKVNAVGKYPSSMMTRK